MTDDYQIRALADAIIRRQRWQQHQLELKETAKYKRRQKRQQISDEDLKKKIIDAVLAEYHGQQAAASAGW